MAQVSGLADKIVEQFKQHSASSLFTVAISGIDASGKGYIAKLLQNELEKKGYRIANINIDPWQRPIPVRLQKENPAENFYENVFRWNDFFEQLIFPFQKEKSIHIETKGIRTDADKYFSLNYCYQSIDILLIEGILLFKKKYLSCYDYKVWIDCSFVTGLQRAVKRNIEKLDKEKLLQDYQAVYYAAQRLHFEKDGPKESADIIFINE